jgi:hypothetical protein
LAEALVVQELARSSLKRAARPLGLIPMQRVLRGLQQRGISLEDRRVLDVFAGTGLRALQYYEPFVGHVEAWDYDEACVAALRRDHPRSTPDTSTPTRRSGGRRSGTTL